MATKASASREGEKPVTLEEVRAGLTAFTDLLKNYTAQLPEPIARQPYLSDDSFAKAQKTLTYLKGHPNLFPGINRAELEENIANYLDLQNLKKNLASPIQMVENARKRQSQIVHRRVLAAYRAAQNANTDGITADPTLSRPLADDLRTLFEKSVETRKKNKAIKAKQEAEQKTPQA